MTWRQLRVLIQHLPPESATMTALRNSLTDEEYEQQAKDGRPEEGRWSMTDQLLAGITDAVRELQHILILVNSDKKARKPRRPEPIRRPGTARQRRREPMSEAAAEKLFTLINGGAA
ncbi:hypothetical protein ACFFSH_38210 [Streptomyces filamentosus]|uniref:Uncharacterized protein n=1 Tax=Streptomyces filamentosus TaxID=67294 RepID=A0A919ER21_STRFL|nr:hypothetical protein [Streptomyces filamentosus]GHG14931.1 hypothetical protein GCM10017667_55500 [Streptomyces filamentosus]